MLYLLSLSLPLSPQNVCLSQGCKELLLSTQDLQFSVNLRFGTSISLRNGAKSTFSTVASRLGGAAHVLYSSLQAELQLRQ